MAATPTPAYVQTPKNTCVTIVNADGQNYKTAYTAGSNGSKIESWWVSSTDTSARDITINLTISATNYQITQISIPITAGTVNSTAAVNILTSSQFGTSTYDASGNPTLYLASGTTLTINAPVSVTSTKTITSTVIATDL